MSEGPLPAEKDRTPTEVIFQAPLPERLAMSLLVLVGSYRGVELLVDSQDRIIGIAGPRWAIERIRHG